MRKVNSPSQGYSIVLNCIVYISLLYYFYIKTLTTLCSKYCLDLLPPVPIMHSVPILSINACIYEHLALSLFWSKPIQGVTRNMKIHIHTFTLILFS